MISHDMLTDLQYFIFTGSVYLLMIIAVKNRRIEIGKIKFDVIYALCNTVHQPDPGYCQAMIYAHDTKHFISDGHGPGYPL